MEEHQWGDAEIEILLMDFDMVRESLYSKTLSKGFFTVLDCDSFLTEFIDFLFVFILQQSEEVGELNGQIRAILNGDGDKDWNKVSEHLRRLHEIDGE